MMRIDQPMGPHIPLEAKVAYLRRPEAYPGPPASVQPRETHMAWVFLTDAHAYKLKKPVQSRFLDFSTAELRRADCDDEVRLNRPLAPDVYDGVVPLTLEATGSLQLDGTGTPCDWLVKMRRLSWDLMLESQIESGRVLKEDLDALAQVLCRYCQSRAPAPNSGEDYRAFVRDVATDNAHELAAPQYGMPAEVVDRVHGRQFRFLDDSAAVFDERVRAHRIAEIHGDLRPEHIFLETPPVIIDCLEFNRRLRTLDMAAEIIFLSLECERLGAAWAGKYLYESYCALMDDHPPAVLAAFYRSWHACIRAKIALWHLKDGETARANDWRGKARAYLELADGCVF